jgi:hypothetical protein
VRQGGARFLRGFIYLKHRKRGRISGLDRHRWRRQLKRGEGFAEEDEKDTEGHADEGPTALGAAPRPIVSAVRGDTMLRWPMLIIGIALLVFSIVASLKFPMLPLEPEAITAQEAAARAREKGYHNVRVAGEPDLERKVYPTLSVRPVYTGRTPTQKYDLCAGSQPLPADLESYLGTVVRIARPLESSYVAMQTVRKESKKKNELIRERLLAPVSGCDGKVWAISAAFQADDHERNQWPETRVVEGVLTRLSEVNKNMRSYTLEHDWKDIKAFVGKELRTSLSDDAFLVLTDYEWHPPTYYYSPLQGTDNTVFVQLSDERAASLNGSVTGVFEAADLKLYDEFADVLGEALPGRIGIVTMETAEQYNTRRVANATGMKNGGMVLSALGAAGIAVRRWRRNTRSARRHAA